MNIFIHRDGENHGPYTLDEIKEYLVNGSVIEADLAWHEGLPDWMILSSVLETRSVQPAVPVSVQPSATNRVDNSLERQTIEELAYYIYVSEGRPEGRALRHWLEAEELFKIESILEPNIFGEKAA